MEKSGYEAPEMLITLCEEEYVIYTSAGDTDVDFNDMDSIGRRLELDSQ